MEHLPKLLKTPNGGAKVCQEIYDLGLSLRGLDGVQTCNLRSENFGNEIGIALVLSFAHSQKVLAIGYVPRDLVAYWFPKGLTMYQGLIEPFDERRDKAESLLDTQNIANFILDREIRFGAVSLSEFDLYLNQHLETIAHDFIDPQITKGMELA